MPLMSVILMQFNLETSQCRKYMVNLTGTKTYSWSVSVLKTSINHTLIYEKCQSQYAN